MSKLTKMKVECKQLWTNGKVYLQGQVFEATEDEVAELLKDKNASVAPAGAEISEGIEQVVDPVEQAIKDKQFAELREQGVMHAPANAGSLSTPQVGPAAALAGSEKPIGKPIPGTKGHE